MSLIVLQMNNVITPKGMGKERTNLSKFQGNSILAGYYKAKNKNKCTIFLLLVCWYGLAIL